MDKNTVSNYGWIVIAVLVLSVMIALATPFGEYIKAGVESTTAGLFETQQSALEAAGIIDVDDTEYIELSSAEDIYALARVLAYDLAQENHFGSSYAIKNDLDNFEYPDDITGATAKTEYLSTASYKLMSNIDLTIQITNDTNFFMGIGSTSQPFKGVFNGNGKTINLKTSGPLAIDSNCNRDIGLFGTTENANINNLKVTVSEDLIVTSSSKDNNIGSLVGRAGNTTISNCNVNIVDSKIGVDFANNGTTEASIGGCVGSGSYNFIENCTVNLSNGTISAKGVNNDSDATYAMFSVGGVLGTSGYGSNNTENIGQIGNQIYNCKVISKNTTQTDVIIATVETGDELCAGGIVGMSFNNAVIKNCDIDIEKGNIISKKTGATDIGKYGTHAGGIIGRLEHTGELFNCNVKGNYLNIESQSNNTDITGNSTTAGGIVGYDYGPYHKNIISINKCSFDGMNTSTINAKTTLASGRAYTGGIAGSSGYIIADCSVKNVTLINKSENSTKSYIGKLVAFYHDHDGNWKLGTYFTPDTPEIRNCTTQNVIADATNNVTVGEVYGRT